MFLAIFEVHPKAERFDDYLALARRLKPILEKVDGFVDNERFESKRRPGWILSLFRHGAMKSRWFGGAPWGCTTSSEAGPLRSSPGLPLENR
jgi:hypothetical protein